nr:uncharacterized protein LOC115265232 [Aedes albopictus]
MSEENNILTPRARGRGNVIHTPVSEQKKQQQQRQQQMMAEHKFHALTARRTAVAAKLQRVKDLLGQAANITVYHLETYLRRVDSCYEEYNTIQNEVYTEFPGQRLEQERYFVEFENVYEDLRIELCQAIDGIRKNDNKLTVAEVIPQPAAPVPIRSAAEQQEDVAPQLTPSISGISIAMPSQRVHEKEILLSTAIVELQDSSGSYHLCRALLDSGSQSSFVTESVVRRLRLRRERVRAPVIGISGDRRVVSHQAVAQIKSMYSEASWTLDFLVVPHVTGCLPARKIDIDQWQIPSELLLADPRFSVPAKVDMLIGAELFFELLLMDRLKLNDCQAMLWKTKLGWIVSGAFPSIQRTVLAASHIAYLESPESNLEGLVQRFWDQEEVGGTAVSSTEDQQCLEHFTKTHRREEGHFVVRLPFRDNLVTGVLKAMDMAIDKVVLWCDSQIVLCWLNKSAASLEIFVGSRVREINQLTHDFEWRYISSKDNPADLASRGVTPSDLQYSNLWWHGPAMLLQNDNLYVPPESRTFSEEQLEIDDHTYCQVVVRLNPCELLTRYSNFRKLQRVVAYLYRFVNNCRKKKTERTSGSLSILELRSATLKIIWNVQREAFADELHMLQHNRTKKK